MIQTAKKRLMHSHPEYQHDGHEHSHALISHEHDAVPMHGHMLQEHDHSHEHPLAALAKHEHGDLRGELRGVVRTLLRVIELGQVNSEQRRVIHAARVIIGAARGSGCAHGKDPDGLYRNATYIQGDRLVCDLCGADITAEASG